MAKVKVISNPKTPPEVATMMAIVVVEREEDVGAAVRVSEREERGGEGVGWGEGGRGKIDSYNLVSLIHS